MRIEPDESGGNGPRCGWISGSGCFAASMHGAKP